MANKNVYVCGTLYHVYISTLKNIEKSHSNEESLLIVNDHTPNLVELAQKLVQEGFFTNYCYVPFFMITAKIHSKKGALMESLRKNKYAIEYVEKFSDINSHYDFIKDAEINLFYNLGLPSIYFLIRYKTNNFKQIEDGLRNYNPKVSNLKALKRKYLLNAPQGEGRDPQIKSIEVQHPEKLPKVVRHKGVKLDLKGLVGSLSKENRLKIFNIFAQDNTFTLDGPNKVILITQPLSEDRIITEEYKIKLYNQILNDHASGCNIYIKAHPREITDYKGKFDQQIKEIPRNFPLEILNFYPDIVFEKGITIFSGALKNLNNVKERIFLGMEYDKVFQVKKKFL